MVSNCQLIIFKHQIFNLLHVDLVDGHPAIHLQGVLGRFELKLLIHFFLNHGWITRGFSDRIRIVVHSHFDNCNIDTMWMSLNQNLDNVKKEIIFKF